MFLKVYIADIAPLYDEATYEYYYSKSIPFRQKKADRFKFQKLRSQSIGAGILLKKALENLGIPKNVWEFTTVKTGKVRLSEAKELRIDFNLSHSEDRAMCVISDCEVGCDVEKIQAHTEIADRFFTEHEAALAHDDADMFTRIWTLKESFIKTTGEGLGRGLNSFEICFEEDGMGKLRAKRLKGDGIIPEKFSLYELNYDDGYKYSVCVKGTEIVPEAEWVDLSLPIGLR
ncbi:MAG: 4'-phosphopantetheinyl transferase superfamily protein [Lachnospiraceae bacterium]|nr:4'-phosphopantetheinyl transferase superfamily protein [Lachnospiraceae bacterium]